MFMFDSVVLNTWHATQKLSVDDEQHVTCKNILAFLLAFNF